MSVRGVILSIGFMCMNTLANYQDDLIKNIKNEIVNEYKLGFLKDKSGKLERSETRDLVERTLVSFLHNTLSIRNDAWVITLKKGLTDTAAAFQKVASYKVLHTVVRELWNKKNAAYKPYKPWIEDSFDIFFRGIKYFNNTKKEHTPFAYIKIDLAPYLARKITVRTVRALLDNAIYDVLKKWEIGCEIIAAYQIVSLIPLIGIEVGGMSRDIVERLYDKGIATGKELVRRYRRYRTSPPLYQHTPVPQIA